MKAADRQELFARLAELNPKPTTELEYGTPFELLVAVTLSAQATDVGVNKATRRLFPVANTPQAILALGEDGLKSYISTIGLYNAKAANVIAACRILAIHDHGPGQQPGVVQQEDRGTGGRDTPARRHVRAQRPHHPRDVGLTQPLCDGVGILPKLPA